MRALTFKNTQGLNAYEAACELADHEMPYPTFDEIEEAGAKVAETLLKVLMDTALEDHITTILTGVIGGFHSAAIRIEREADKAADDMRRLAREFDGNEIADQELQDATLRQYRADAAQMITESLRDACSQNFTELTGEVWTPWKGSAKNRNSVTFAQVEAKDALKARAQAQNSLCNPGDSVVVFRGSSKANKAEDASRIFDALNYARELHPDMKLACTGNNGAETIAMNWAAQKGVQRILAKANFDKFKKAAPFRANDELMALDPVLVFTLEASLAPEKGEDVTPFGPVLNIQDAAKAKGIKVLKITAKKAAAKVDA